ncbi:MAG: 5-aminolevulinate synthase, partial [Shimia sp.]
MDTEQYLDAALNRLHEEGRYRTFIDIERSRGQYPRATWTRPDGTQQDITVWCGNDYLGMGQHPVVLSAMHEALDATGAGSGGTRNISGTTVYHKRLEAELADLHGKEEALIFTSAYIANDATLSTLPKLFPGLVILSDELNHASMIEGIRRNGGAKRIFRHNDISHLREQLEDLPRDIPKLIAFESVYSMDGDFAPIAAICDLADEFGALTYLDEVHAVGMYG